MTAFERCLSVWVALAILAGLGLGQIAPGLVNFLASLEYGSVNFVVAVLIWFMVYPMMVVVDFSSLARIRTAQGADHHAHRQLADQALHHGRPRRAVLRADLRALHRARHGEGIVAELGLWRIHFANPCGYTACMSKPPPALYRTTNWSSLRYTTLLRRGAKWIRFEDSRPKGSSRCSNAFSPLFSRRYVHISI